MDGSLFSFLPAWRDGDACFSAKQTRRITSSWAPKGMSMSMPNGFFRAARQKHWRGLESVPKESEIMGMGEGPLTSRTDGPRTGGTELN